MYINRVVLRNIKGFEECDLTFSSDEETYAGWATVTGNNSSGKTAFLRSIAVALLGPDQARGLLPDFRGWVAEGKESGTISVEIKPNREVDKTYKGGNPVQNTLWAEVELYKDGPVESIKPADVFRHKKKGAINGPWQQTTPGWLALGYGPFRRLYGSSPDAQRLMVIPGRVPRFATLFKEDATLGEGEEWLKQLKYRTLEDRPGDAEILNVLVEFINDDFLRQGVSIKDVTSDGIFLQDPAGRRTPLRDMSEGYRSALAMLVDIFRHMVNTYGITDLVEKREGGGFCVRKPGVILIDEIDAHLHPAWQREIGFWLKRHFPGIQFIVTTHSPLVCQAADDGRVYHMPDLGEGQPFVLNKEDFEAIITGKPDEILLTPAFGLQHTRSPRAVNARERRARLMAKKSARLSLSHEESTELQQLELFVRPGA